MHVLIADDHSIVRSGLSHLLAELEAGVSLVEATTFGRAREIIEAGTPFDLIILDLRMPGMGSLDALQDLVARVAPVPVVIFSMLETPDDMRAVLARGVRAYIPKSTDDVLIINILRLVLAGGVYVPPVLGVGAATAPAEQAPPLARSPFEGLTRRQMDVLELMAEGLSNQEIGERLGLNLSTVKTHVTGVLKALSVDSRTQAVLLVKRTGRDRLH
ncbi:MAG TPA: response regulator transcription factor [Azospirillaceae bacterium]|nr:response regulator transcription factor [Azospirillaceae bacterium]